MTQSEWQVCENPRQMIGYLRSCAPLFRALLGIWTHPQFDKDGMFFFACACLRQIWHLLPAAATREIEIVEADALRGYYRYTPTKEWYTTRLVRSRPAIALAAHAALHLSSAIGYNLIELSRCSAFALASDLEEQGVARTDAETRAWRRQSDYLRCIVGSPFLPYGVCRMRALHRRSELQSLVNKIYNCRELPRGTLQSSMVNEVADLVNGFLPEEGMLQQHLRETTDHVMGCWVFETIRKEHRALPRS